MAGVLHGMRALRSRESGHPLASPIPEAEEGEFWSCWSLARDGDGVRVHQREGSPGARTPLVSTQ